MKKIYLVVFALWLCNNLFAQQNNVKIDSSKTTGYYTSFDGTSIYYETIGAGKPIVLIHGFMNTVESWRRAALYNDLLVAGYKLVLLDLRGNGKSDKPHTLSAYQNDAEAKDVMGLMKHLKLKKYSVIGYSRGAIIASRVLVLNKKVQAAVIGGMGTAFMDTAWPRRKMFYHALLGEPVPELASMVEYVKKSGLDQLALAYSQGGQPSTSAKEFAKVRKPVMVICGDKDSDNGAGKDLSLVIPHAQFASVPGDHNNAMRTKEFSNAVMEFLRKEDE